MPRRPAVPGRFPIPVVIVRERIRTRDVFVASTPIFDIASQGNTVEEAVQELKEAVELFLEEPGVPIRMGVQEIFTSTTTIHLPEKRECIASRV